MKKVEIFIFHLIVIRITYSFLSSAKKIIQKNIILNNSLFLNKRFLVNYTSLRRCDCLGVLQHD